MERAVHKVESMNPERPRTLCVQTKFGGRGYFSPNLVQISALCDKNESSVLSPLPLDATRCARYKARHCILALPD